MRMNDTENNETAVMTEAISTLRFALVYFDANNAVFAFLSSMVVCMTCA